MPNDPLGKSATPETRDSNVAQLLTEFRQMALAEGVALSKIDSYLLKRSDVPEEVKIEIRREREAAEHQSPADDVEEIELAAHTDSAAEKSDQVVETVGAPTISGEVTMLGAKAQIEQIKSDMRAGEKADTQPGLSSELPVEKTETISAAGPESAKSENALLAQTAEQKEQPAGTGRQDSGAQSAIQDTSGVTGYAVASTIAANASQIAQKGDVKDASTWQASLLERLIEMWGNLKGLFTAG